MTDVDHSKSDVALIQKVEVLSIKADKQRSERIDPGEGTFGSNTALIPVRVATALAASFVLRAVALVLREVGLPAVMETGLASFLGIESAVGVEGGASDG